jgi:CubicO group peptidase (beta-lactamase class C family)
MTMPETIERLETDIAEGLFTRGAQVCVTQRGETVLDVALGDDGMGRPVRPDTLFRVYCSIKPVAAMAVAHLVEAGTLDLDAPMSEFLPDTEALQGGVTTRHVMSHTAGLHKPAAVVLEMIPPDERVDFLDRYQRPPGWHLGTEAAYSELFAWHLVGRLLETLSGEPLREHLRRVVLDPLGMHDTFIGMTTAEFEANLDRVGINVDLRGWRGFPMLFERTERVLCEANPAHGGYTTARDLAQFYGSLLRVLDGESVAGLPSTEVLTTFCRNARPRSYDLILLRECDYGLGFMTSLAEHHFGKECSPESFGHSGNVGSSFAFADPEADLAVAVVFNGIVDPDSAFLRRPALVRSMFHDLDADADAEAEADALDDAEPELDAESEPAIADGGGRRGLFGRRRRR